MAEFHHHVSSFSSPPVAMVLLSDRENGSTIHESSDLMTSSIVLEKSNSISDHLDESQVPMEEEKKRNNELLSNSNAIPDHNVEIEEEKRLRILSEALESNSNNSYTDVVVPSLSRGVVSLNLPARKNQDRGKHWFLQNPGGQSAASEGVGIYAIADGHGRRGDAMADRIMTGLDEFITSTHRSAVDWSSQDDLTPVLQQVFAIIEATCRQEFGDMDGGATLSVCVDRPGMDFWIAHVGDSDVCFLDLDESSREAIVLSEDHSPLSMKEFLRMIEVCPSACFEYDRQRKDAPRINIYSVSAEEPGTWRKNPAPTRNVYYKNRANDLATYVSAGGGCASLANTRAIGDFRMKTAVALSAEPFISRRPPLTSSQRVVVASDGFWDSWPAPDLLCLLENKRGFCEIISELERTHIAITEKYFGSCSDDTFLYLICPF